MKQKLLISFLLTTILTLAIVSAANFTISVPTPNSLTKSNTQTSFVITNNGPEAANIQVTLPSTITDLNGHSISIASVSQLTFNNVAASQNTAPIIITYSGDTTNFNIGKTFSNILVKGTQVSNTNLTTTTTVPLNFENDFCKYGEKTNSSGLSISSIDISNADGDDTEWKPLDKITVKMKVENNGDTRVTSIYSEIGLIDSKGKNVIGNVENLADKKINLGTINDGKDKTSTFTFTVPVDFNEENYYLVLKAYKSGKEAELCTSLSSDLDNTFYQLISGIRESETEKEVVVDNIKLSPETAAKCGERVQVSADVVNIGVDDFLDQFKVTIYNKELGINLEQIVREDLKSGDSYNVDFEFDVPKNAAEKTYALEFRTYYDYDDSDNTYQETSDKTFVKTIQISGECTVASTTPSASVQISAELDSETPEAIAGKQVIVKTTLKNTAATPLNYVVSAYGNSQWSSLVSIEPNSLTLQPGESKIVSIILSLDKEAQGDKEFVIKATYGDKATEQKVALSVSQPTAQLGSLLTHLRDNWFIYVIILVNVILIIAIITVIKRMLSPRKREFE
jgi:hypothetical protein